jgi:tetratricopeptide (TPR) repeat protein
MEDLFAGRLDEVSTAIAMHLARGGQPARAIPFFERAAAVASRISAMEESIRCLTEALRLLAGLPATPERDARELELRSSLSMALNAARGYADPAIEENLDRVMQLAGNDVGVPVRWLWVAFTMRFMLGDLRATRAISEQALAYSEIDPSCRCEAHHAMAGTLLSMGEIEAACRHFEAALAEYDEQHPRQSALGSDLGVFAHAWYSHALWLRGDEAAALAHASQGVGLAQRLNQPYSETLALAYSSLLHQLRGDRERLVACAEAAVAHCERYGIGYYGDWARLLLGWARGQDDPVEGVAVMTAALAQLDARRAYARRPYYLSLLADTERLAGHREHAAAIVDAAIEMATQRSDVWWLPVLYVQKSALGARDSRADLVQRGLALAGAQGSRGLEHRILPAAV